ncbi:class I tRNA ligase family protein [Sinorhizobium meliloti SM11]|uniref:Probable methionyl-tRNA synthetase n=1 Tax=Sinorhizobium meliloti (strain SM11) TaxID=707241 RepID=A4KVK9_SINMM|nr:class I tRNA ligase family protein [Sinorhizobium meliloti]ABN47110.1 probable methionyl-tRNA synthetase [Sinorhizobium meliloti SM11]MDE4561801.1 class I tRNA ligase family protein [Sinorhizobium meliloti SM11]
MKNITLDESAYSAAFGIEMAPVGRLAGPGGAASFGRVLPGGETTPHQHDEAEAFVILRGEGELVVDNIVHRVGPGSVAVFEPFETHTLRNTGDVPLEFLDLYGRDPARATEAAANTGRERFTDRPVFVFSTPPTPNGDLHLGHLSGPYLGADVFVRFQRMNGVAAYHLTGSDDFQSYVVARARQKNHEPLQVAAQYAAEIRATLSLMDIMIDQYTVTGTDPTYREGLQDFFSRLVRSGAVQRRTDAALFDAETRKYLYEVDVGGRCPNCSAPTGGNICEECGEPNFCVDIVNAKSNLSIAEPVRGTADRFSLPLHNFRETVLAHHRTGKVSPRLQELARRVFEREEFHLPLTHPSEWGVPPVEPVEGRQVIWVWPEMAYGFLHGIAELGRRHGRDWSADAPQRDWKIVHFFGYDNSFYHTILYPVLYALAYPDWACDIEYNVNEFYLLDGEKFSTSRRHAIWGKDILSSETVDAVRYYLCLTRGETERTNFELAACQAVISETLIGRWQGWLNGLGAHIAALFDGRAPDAGVWSPIQSAFLARLQTRLDAIAIHYGADGFSLNGVMRELNGLVDDVIRFSKAHQSLSGNPGTHDEWRTVIALELAAARLLAQCAAPVMPRFAGKLAEAIGTDGATSHWSDHVTLLPPGAEIQLAGACFFAVPRTASSGDSGQMEVQGPPPAVPGAIEPTALEARLRAILHFESDAPVRSKSLADLGLTSLGAITLQHMLRTDWSIDLLVSDILEAKTIDKLFALVVERSAAREEEGVLI